MLSLFIKLKKSKGAGPDGISSQLIIDCADSIFNSSLANGIFPDDSKSARVTPLFKYAAKKVT